MPTTESKVHFILTPHSVFPGKDFLKVFKEELQKSLSVVIISGVFKGQSIEMIREDLLEFLKKGRGVEIYTAEIPAWSDLEYLYYLQILLNDHTRSKVRLYRHRKAGTGPLHSKVVVFEGKNGEKSVLIGSVNFTQSAFISNVETAVLLNVKEHSPVDNLLDVVRKYSSEPCEMDVALYRRYKESSQFKAVESQFNISGRGDSQIVSDVGGVRIWKVASGDPTWGRKESLWGWTWFHRGGVISTGNRNGSDVTAFKSRISSPEGRERSIAQL